MKRPVRETLQNFPKSFKLRPMFGYFQTSTRTKLTFLSTTTASRPVACSPHYFLFSSVFHYQVVCAPCNPPHVVPLVVLVTHPCVCARSPPVTVLGFCSCPLPLCSSSPTSGHLLILTLPDRFTFALRHVAAAAVDARLSPSSNPSLALQTTSQRGIRPLLPSSHSTSQRLRFDAPCLWLRIRRTAQRVVGWGNVF
ncbi:uncharacterized protein LACBIDRAFT_302209 [Laccaria bicolor S238N-H82]|uniref:Predicted protein n=1 Tax=Laccaria bicolor (strain S238N-H82 / ATCC MYA-4686) TaxID=486041 RepID=B0DHB1_LACBS|nr:uncharacterized protein LACBIDRAFT_302209 [Laccaria bicolor S238N-H82]EDR06081.1 predicted protein [Laccaria bicolor S238N-H82]|eukprot:XP_001883369.1 predicted protein [Laccaria bicolor S238N-H82]